MPDDYTHYWFKPPSVDTGVIACGPLSADWNSMATRMTTRNKDKVTCPPCKKSWEYTDGHRLETGSQLQILC